MTYIGRKDCEGADFIGNGGPHVEMPSNNMKTHELYDFFEEHFGFNMHETITIMGVHSVGVMHRYNSGFGNIGKDEGWVFDADEYILDNRYYYMFDLDWELELVHNRYGIPSRYQWYHEGECERPVMLNSDMALVVNTTDYMHVDSNGNEGAVDCVYVGKEGGGYNRGYRRELQPEKFACPVASDALEKILEYKMDNAQWLYDFEKVLEKMVMNGY